MYAISLITVSLCYVIAECVIFQATAEARAADAVTAARQAQVS